MFESDVEKLATSSENKIKLMNRFPPGYLALSALAGAYLGFGVVLIFSVGALLAGTQCAPFMILILGVSFGVAVSLVIFAGSELFTGNNMVFAIGKLKDRVGTGSIIKLFTFCFVGNLFGSILLNQSLMSLALFLPHGAEISITGFIHNQIFVTAGNMLGGGLMLGMVYVFSQSTLTSKSQKKQPGDSNAKVKMTS